MKRILTIIAAISMAIVAMAQAGGITVSTYNKDTKETKLQFFNCNELSNAIEAAQPNDTIYFSAGEYTLNNLPSKTYIYNTNGYTDTYRIISKPLVFIGVGAEETALCTRWTGSNHVVVDLTGYEGDEKNISLEGIYLNKSFHVATDLDNLTFRNFQGTSIYFVGDPENTSRIGNMLIDRCYLSGDVHMGYGRIDNFNILNTRIRGRLYGKSLESEGIASLNHCYIEYIDNYFKGLIKNSLIYYDYSGSDTVLEYCGYYSSDSSIKNNCYKISSSVYDYNKDPSQLSEECVSDDGTPLGTSGGTNPYTLNPSYPTPDGAKSKANIVIDDDGTKKLKVSVAIIGENAEE